MSDWRWEYDPDAAHVISGLPDHVITAAEKLADELVDLAVMGVDITDIGSGPDHGGPGGVRRFPLPTGGWLLALPLPRYRLVALTHITPPLEHL